MDKNIVKYIEDDLITHPIIDWWLHDLQFPFSKDCSYNQTPTLSEVAKWLREEHHLFCQVMFKGESYVGKVIDLTTGHSKIKSRQKRYSDYAECLEDLIDRTLCKLAYSKALKEKNTNNWCENEII